MTRFNSLTGAGAAALFVLALSAPAGAQPGPRGQGAAGGMLMGPGMMSERGFGFMCSPRAAGMAEWRINRIEAAVKPTDAQKAKLEELRAASAKASEQVKASCAAAVPTRSTERLALMEKRLESMQQALKTVRPAFDAFYASLDDKQKASLDAAGPRQWGWGNWRWR